MSEQLEPVPDGWKVVKLSELSKYPRQDIVDGPFGSNLKASEYVDAGVPIIRLQNIDRNRFIDKNIKFVTEEKAKQLNRHSFQPDDLIITKLGDPLGKACIVPSHFQGGIIVADVVRARINKEITSNEYVMYAINSPFGSSQLDSEIKGTTRPRVNLGHIRALLIPLPPLAEQRRIVAAVEALLTQVNAIRDRLNRVPTFLKRFRQAILAAACDGRLTDDWREKNSDKQVSAQGIAASEGVSKSTWDDGLPESWVVGTISSTSVNIVDCPHSTPKWTESGRVCLRTTNFLPGLLDLSEVRYVSEATFIERTARLVPRPNDIVYSREGGILGIACMIPDGLTTCLGQRMMLIRTHEWMNPTFVMHVLNCPQTLLVVKELTGGTAAPHLNVGDVKAFQIPIPPLPEQHDIVRRVNALFALAVQIDAKLTLAKQRVDKLTQAILAKAFRGELVPTEAELARREGRTFETAEELLERVKQEANISNGERPSVRKKARMK